MLSTQTLIAWYYVGVMVLLFAGQNVLMSNAHKEAVTKLTASYEQKLKDAGMPAAAKVVAQAAPAPTPAAAPATKAIIASPASESPAKAELAAAEAQPAPAAKVEPAPVAKASDSAAIRTLVASPAKEPASPSSQASASKSLPAMPVKVAFRSEPFRKGKVIVVTNTSKQERAYTLNVRRPSTGEKESFKIKVAPSAETRFVGDGEWAFKEGDRLQIALAGHAPQSHEIP